MSMRSPLRVISRLPEQEEEPANRSEWITCAGARWLDSLTMKNGVPMSVEGSPLPPHEMHYVFRDAFLRLKDDLDNLECLAAGALGPKALRVWLTVRRKTLPFGRVAEKISRSVFVNGQTRGGELTLKQNGAVLLPPSGLTDQHLSEGIRTAIERGWVTRVPAETHPRYGQSFVFMPAPAGWLLDRFFDAAFTIARRQGHNHFLAVAAYQRAGHQACADLLLQRPPGAANQPILETPRQRLKTTRNRDA